MILLNPFILTFLAVESLLFFFAFIAFYYSFKIVLGYRANRLSTKDYLLSKQGYLVSTIIVFILIIKLPLFLFFVWSMDEISFLVPGAMCGVGIVDATNFGAYMLFLKIINLFLLSGWLFINYKDFQSPTSNFFITKFKFFIPLFIFFIFEFVFEWIHFSSIRVDEVVECCSQIFKSTALAKVPFWHKNLFILSIFYFSFLLLLFWALTKIEVMFGFFSFIFMFFTIYAIIRYFSPYIYELPLHKCPFCMLQQEYHYIGYLIYLLIFFGTLPGLFVFLEKILEVDVDLKLYKISMVINTILVLLLSYFPLSYYIKNGVWL